MEQSELDGYLRGLGLMVETVHDGNGTRFSVIRGVCVPRGTHTGQIIDVGLQQVDAVPYVAPSAVHVRPSLVPMGERASQASTLGTDWQDLSRRLDLPPTPQVVWAWVLTVIGEL